MHTESVMLRLWTLLMRRPWCRACPRVCLRELRMTMDHLIGRLPSIAFVASVILRPRPYVPIAPFLHDTISVLGHGDYQAKLTVVSVQFVVDGIWTTDHTAPQVRDGQNNLNNVLTPEHMSRSHHSQTPGAAFVSGATPQATTAQLAQSVPLEARNIQSPSGMPGDFPETPLQEHSEFATKSDVDTSASPSAVNDPLNEPAKDRSSYMANSGRDETVQPSSRANEPESRFGVNPLPATTGTGNPIHLRPGARVPEPGTFTTNTVSSTVTLDEGSYDRAGSAANSLPLLPPVVTPQDERDRRGTGVLDLPPITRNLIPESSLPMGPGISSEHDPGVTISSVAPTSSTVGLAAGVPLEGPQVAAEVPQIVKESQHAAHVDPEASASAEAVQEKHAVEDELTREIKAAPPVSEGIGGGGKADSGHRTEPTNSSSTNSTGAAMHAVSPRDTADSTIHPETSGSTQQASGIPEGHGTDTGPRAIPASVMQSIREINQGADQTRTAAGVPEVVTESIHRAHQSPEAASNDEMVAEKRAVESELLKEIKPNESVGQPAPTESAVMSETAPKPTKRREPQADIVDPPERGEQSIKREGNIALGLGEVQQTEPGLSSGERGLAASAATPAVTPITKATMDSKMGASDVSPMSKGLPPTPPKPVVTSGVNEGTMPETSTPKRLADEATSTSSTPQSANLPVESPGSSTSKKDKRRSGFFGKLKEKLRK